MFLIKVSQNHTHTQGTRVFETTDVMYATGDCLSDLLSRVDESGDLAPVSRELHILSNLPGHFLVDSPLLSQETEGGRLYEVAISPLKEGGASHIAFVVAADVGEAVVLAEKANRETHRVQTVRLLAPTAAAALLRIVNG